MQKHTLSVGRRVHKAKGVKRMNGQIQRGMSPGGIGAHVAVFQKNPSCIVVVAVFPAIVPRQVDGHLGLLTQGIDRCDAQPDKLNYICPAVGNAKGKSKGSNAFFESRFFHFDE